MENRTIIIANTKTQRQYRLNTSATTLGELQDEMSAQGIDYDGMTFTEGISKTQLVNRDSILPSNLMYKGQLTNNLVMLLTNTKKQIASGAGKFDRKALYAEIKSLALEETVKANYGKNFTMVSNADLAAVIEEAKDNNTKLSDVREELNHINENDKKPENTEKAEKIETPHAGLVAHLYSGFLMMTKEHCLYADDVEALGTSLLKLAEQIKENNPVITNDDIDEMLANL